MTKRPKLSLSSPQQGVKKRPGTFNVAPKPAEPSHDIPREQTAKPVSHAPFRPRASISASTPAGNTRASPGKQPTWLNAGTIAKAVLVVGAAALSIFLLKRRLF